MINPFAVCSSIYKMPVFYSLLHGPNRDDKTQNIFTQNWAASSPHLKPLPLSFHAQFHVQQTKNIWGIIGVNMTVTVNDNGWLDHKWWKIYPKKPHRPDQLVVVVTQECDSFCRYHLLTIMTWYSLMESWTSNVGGKKMKSYGKYLPTCREVCLTFKRDIIRIS